MISLHKGFSKKIILFIVIAAILVFFLFQTRQVENQFEIVQVAGGSYFDIKSEQLYGMLQNKDFVFINVHIPFEGSIEKTDAFVPYNQIEQNLDKFPQDKSAKIVLYCKSGRMSAIAAETLVRLGYTNIFNLKGGFLEWKRKGFPLLGNPV